MHSSTSSRSTGLHGTARAQRLLMPLLIAAAALAAPALGAPSHGIAAQQSQDPTPHSDARLISEVEAIRPGEPFTVGVHITLDEGWHTYWRNAGDAGSGTIMEWQLPAGFSADSLRYPRPQRVEYPPLMNYGYYDQVVLLAEVTPPADLEPGRTVPLRATADFLVCEDICIPARAELSLDLPVAGGAGTAPTGSAVAARPSPQAGGEAAALIRESRAELPLETDRWRTRAARTDSGFVLAVRPPEGWDQPAGGAYFFPHDATTLSHTADQPVGLADGEIRLRLTASDYLLEDPERLDGILVLPEGSAFDDAGHRVLAVSAPVETGAVAWASEPVTPLTAGPADVAGAAGGSGLTLVVALLFALMGGVILNLMPCVFPILSLKALGFATRGGDRRGMRLDGLAFGAGVVLTFLLVAGVLMAVRAGGASVGWGYQLQSPTVVGLLAALMFGLGLWLAGVVELGSSLTRLGNVGGGEGPGGAFMTGVLATVVATPCTAPFMGAAIGAAFVRPPVEGLTIFAALGVGMALPYVMLSMWPALARRLPKPGRWMETFKQVLAFPMFAVAIWLVWVFGLQVGVGGAARLLFALLLLSMGAWLLGRWPATVATGRTRLVTRGLAAVALILAILAGTAAVRGAEPLPGGGAAGESAALAWEPYSQEAVQSYRAEGRPVFVDFTAAWCISCQVNERVALETRAVQLAFRERNVALLKADWTRRDPAITEALASFGRVGVPLYVLYPADPAAEPRVLPELLTQGLVLKALSEVLGPTPDARQARTEEETGS